MKRIVRFDNGAYAIQTGRFPKKFLDLKSNCGYTWSMDNNYFNSCMTDSLEDITKIYDKLYPKIVEIIKK